MAPRKDIRPSDAVLACDVCGRTLLRGERADTYLDRGERRLVCELCRGRAVHDGWVPENQSLEPRTEWAAGDRRGGRLIGRLRGRRERPGRPRRSTALDATSTPPFEEQWQDDALVEGLDEPEHDASAATPVAAGASTAKPPPVSYERHVHAIPAGDDQQRARALELFNASEHPRSIAGIARSLGSPTVAVRSEAGRAGVVSIVVAWELSWYRYEVDLADEYGGVRVARQGQELAELDADEQQANATADERGLLALGG